MADGKNLSVKLDIGTWSAALGLLIQKGLRLGSYIDKQERRREDVLARIDQLVSRIKAERAP